MVGLALMAWFFLVALAILAVGKGSDLVLSWIRARRARQPGTR